MMQEAIPHLVRERVEALPSGLVLSIGRGLDRVSHVERAGRPRQRCQSWAVV